MKLKDVLHFYLGCEVDIKILGAVLVGVTESEIEPGRIISIIKVNGVFTEYYIDEIKPILHRLEDMSEDHSVELVRLCGFEITKIIHIGDLGISFEVSESWHQITYDKLNDCQFAFLCKHRYDIFKLIDSGHAIDYKTLN